MVPDSGVAHRGTQFYCGLSCRYLPMQAGSVSLGQFYWGRELY